MVQTGDPTSTGRGGSSIYGKNFDDEIHPGLKHTGSLNTQPSLNNLALIFCF